MTLKIKTYPELVAYMLAAIGEKTGLTNFNIGSVVRTTTEVFAEVVAELYAFGAGMLKQGFLDTATTFWLDRKAREYGLTRKPAVKAEGTVVYSRKTAKDTNVPIPTGSIVTTPKDQSGTEYRYFTTQAAVLQAGELSVEAPVIAENAGSAYNVGPGSISKMKTFITGIDAVTNPEDWITTIGVDEETDGALRQRCFLAWEELSQGGTAAAYISWALSVPGVKSAFVDDTLPRGEGTVDVYIMGEAGPPDPALIEAVQEVVDNNRPITADALVFSPEVVTVPVTLGVTPRAGYDTAAMDTEIRRRLSFFFGDIEDPTLAIVSLGVGKDVVIAQIVGLVMAVPGVYSITVDAPAADIVIDPNQFPEQGMVTITMEAPSHE
ncbi:MAG: baseplate J/gp47 family protein [Pseudomonadota bacterium]